MQKVLKFLHLTAVSVFVGSIPGHILLGVAAGRAADPAIALVWYQAKHLLTAGLTGSALLAAMATGAVVLLRRRRLLHARWLQLKLLLVLLIAANGLLVLTPISAELATLAAQAAEGQATMTAVAALKARESIAGAANIAMLALVLALAVFRPQLGARSAALHG